MGCNILFENVLKGIVVTYAKTGGVPLHQLQDEIVRHARGVCPPLNMEQLKNALREINGVYVYPRNGIWQASTRPITDFDKNRKSPKPSVHMAKPTPPNVILARRNENAYDHGPIDENNNCSAMHTKNTSNKSNNSIRWSEHNSHSARLNPRRTQYNRNAQRTAYYDNKITSAAFYDHEMVGDDFFMSIATIELNCRYTKKRAIRLCGLCVSGQTIQTAAERLRSCQGNKIILNVGTVDLLHGRDFIQMRNDFVHLMDICKQRNIQVIITTLAPVANKLYADDFLPKYNAFNNFLIQTYSSTHKVIDIRPCMIDRKSHKTLFDCYQAAPVYVSGSDKPHLLWNRIGRQRILKLIRNCIGI